MFEALCFEGKEVSDKKKREQFKKLVAGIVGVRMDRSASNFLPPMSNNRSLSTDVREPRTATIRRTFPFMAWFCPLPRTGKALVDVCGLMLQTRWRANVPKREKFNFRLPYVAQKRLRLRPIQAYGPLILLTVRIPSMHRIEPTGQCES